MQSQGNDFIGYDLLVNKKKSDAASVISSLKSKSKNKLSSSDTSSVSSFVVRSAHNDDGIKVLPTRPRSKSSKAHSISSSSSDASDTSSDITDSSSSSSSISSRGRYTMTQEEILNAKREILYQFDRLERKGVKLPKKFTMASSLEEIKLEYERIKTDREVEASIKFQRQMLMTCVTGVEFLNNKFDPFDVKLDGWSESISENVVDYDDIFEELYHKYKGKAKMPPELRLLFALGGSAVMFHFSNSMMKYGFENAMKQNPELVKQFAQATVSSMANNPAPKSSSSPLGGLLSGMGGIGGLIGSLFGGGGGSPFGGMGGMPTNSPPPAPKAQMRGPSNVDDILKELNETNTRNVNVNAAQVKQPTENFDRIEVVSTMSESDMSDIPEDAMSGVFSIKKKNMQKSQQARRTLNI
jgi:hypothetical protein